MATIDEVRDIVFYIIRKLNDLIINFTTEQAQPQPPQPRPRRRSHDEIMNEIEEIRRNLYTPPPSPPPPPPPPPSPSPQEMIGEFIKQDEERIIDLQKQAHEKRIILNYLLDELIQQEREKKMLLL